MRTNVPDRCEYCGAALDPAFYFCRVCATPYVEEDAVLPRVRAVVPTAGMRIREKAPQVVRLFWTYFSVVLGGALLGRIVLASESLGAQVFFIDGLLLLTTVFFAAAYWRSLLPQVRRVGFDHWEAWAGLLALLPLLGLNAVYTGFLRGLEGVDATSFIQQLREAGLSESALFLTICIFPALTEEVAFRGLLQHWLHIAVSPARAIVLAAALFALMHFTLLSMPYLFAVGCLLGWLRWRTGSLWPCILAHFLHNWAVLAWLGT